MSERKAGAASAGRSRRLSAAALTLPLVAAGLLPAATSTAHAATSDEPGIAVAMGDSYISGEAGRWMGNSVTFTGSRAGTDRAWTGIGYSTSKVYGTSYTSGCDRSDSSEVVSAFGAEAVNIACAGAHTEDLFRAGSGGESFKGEAPQADQLAAIAERERVGLIALSVGGNDLGFTDIIAECVKSYELSAPDCVPDVRKAVDAEIDMVMENVGTAVDEIRAVMSARGYSDSDYRIVLQSYPSPVPRSSEARYPESGWSRTDQGGCPLSDDALDWARDGMVPQVAERLAQVAADRGVQFLDVQDLLQGHEVCSTSARLATSSQKPSAATSEWARFLTTGLTQGTARESFHPNHYGQSALGRCLSLIADEPADRHYACHNKPGEGAYGVYLDEVS
ncbi:GDSL-type esterase/lipase family protein [Streptomyces sp. NPDC056361]|uniref:GDSL-type esterase/lipase family protein n=1 Tax=Streptomyces sp. NPDC056361 TaxID=3345795 RepID=UPI0035DC2481